MSGDTWFLWVVRCALWEFEPLSNISSTLWQPEVVMGTLGNMRLMVISSIGYWQTYLNFSVPLSALCLVVQYTYFSKRNPFLNSPLPWYWRLNSGPLRLLGKHFTTELWPQLKRLFRTQIGIVSDWDQPESSSGWWMDWHLWGGNAVRQEWKWTSFNESQAFFCVQEVIKANIRSFLGV